MLIHRLVRFYRGLRRRRTFGLAFIAGMLSVCLLGNAVCFYYFDGVDKQLGFGDAIWYSVISITTIGYGDFYASSAGARIGTFAFIVVLGLATFSVTLGMMIDWATEVANKGRRGMSKIIANDHILIVNFPSASRVGQLISELRSDPEHRRREIVIVTDQIDELPFEIKDVLFVYGSVLERETYERAHNGKACLAVILATSYADSNSDAVVASAASVMDTINSELHIVAECLNVAHRMLFDSVNCNSLVFSMQVSCNLLAQEAQDPGISQLVDTISSNQRGTTLYSTLVSGSLDSRSYQDLAKSLLDRNINMLCVNRGEQSLTSFVSLMPADGDQVIYATDRRMTWSELVAN